MLGRGEAARVGVNAGVLEDRAEPVSDVDFQRLQVGGVGTFTGANDTPLNNIVVGALEVIIGAPQAVMISVPLLVILDSAAEFSTNL